MDRENLKILNFETNFHARLFIKFYVYFCTSWVHFEFIISLSLLSAKLRYIYLFLISNNKLLLCTTLNKWLYLLNYNS